MGFTKKEQDGLDEINENLAALNEEGLKEKLDAMSKEELKAFIGQTTLNEIENQDQKKNDQDLNDKKDAAKAAGAKYKDISVKNATKVDYAKYLLEGQGVVGVSEPTVND